MERSEITLYPASALFNGRSTYFNCALVEEFENLGFKTNFPQRDGFEFGNLQKALAGKLPPEEIQPAVETIIYYLDMGVFVLSSDVVVANLDEPQDEGVLVELAHAKNHGIYTVGFRTDVRSPYGSSQDTFGGMHFFPGLYLCDAFLYHHMPCQTPGNARKELKSLVTKIDNHLSTLDFKKKLPLQDNPLFSGIDDLHSPEGLNELAQRYVDQKEKLDSQGPKML